MDGRKHSLSEEQVHDSAAQIESCKATPTEKYVCTVKWVTLYNLLVLRTVQFDLITFSLATSVALLGHVKMGNNRLLLPP